MKTNAHAAEFSHMEQSELRQGMLKQASLLLLLLFLSGCSILFPEPPPPADTTIPQPSPEPVVVLPPVVEPRPEPEPEPQPLPPPVQQPIAPLVAVVLSDRTAAYTTVADALDDYLDKYEIYDLDDQSLGPRDAFAAIAETEAKAVVAIGLPAARAAQRFSTVPVVFSQVFNFGDYDHFNENIKGVAVLPPISLHIEAWRNLDPSIRNVGAILGAGHEALIEETNRALNEQGVKFHYAIAGSDRETLYLFNRLVRDIDGYILFPDNRILSRSVLEEMMSYAARHRVQVAVFNQSLLGRGAVFSASTVPADIAETIATVLEDMIAGKGSSLPNLSALSEIELNINQQLIQKFGLDTSGSRLDASVADAQ